MNGREITAAAIQMSSTPNKDENFDTAERLIRSAVSSGGDLITLPELWNCHGLEDVYRRMLSPYQGRRRSFSLASQASSESIYSGVRSSKETPNPRNCTIHPLSSGLTAGCRPFTARYTSSM